MQVLAETEGSTPGGKAQYVFSQCVYLSIQCGPVTNICNAINIFASVNKK